MNHNYIWKEVKKHAVALISLIVALIALSYGAWRDEETEKNRNLRFASFEMLKNLGELQAVVNHAYYNQDDEKGDPYIGWSCISMIGDLSLVLPKPIPKETNDLLQVWSEEWQKIDSSEASVKRVSQEIDVLRQDVRKIVTNLR